MRARAMVPTSQPIPPRTPMADYATVGAAEALLSASSGGAWTLADALVEDTKHLQTDTDVAAELIMIAETLAELGIVTPNGDPYLVPALVTLRRNGLAWPPAERYPVAAYRTHQEAATPLGRIVLAALAAVAVGRTVACPEEVDADAWLSAVARVERRRDAGRRAKYIVAANDVRIAMQRTPNVPMSRDAKSPISELLFEVSEATQALGSFARRFVNADPSDAERERIATALRRLLGRAQATLDVVTASDVTEADFEALLQEEGQ